MLSLIAINSIIPSNSIVFLSNTFESQSVPWREENLAYWPWYNYQQPSMKHSMYCTNIWTVIYCTRNFKICLASHLICLLKILTDTVNLKTEEKKKIIRWRWVKGSGTWCSEGNFGSSLFTRKEKGLEAMEMS